MNYILIAKRVAFVACFITTIMAILKEKIGGHIYRRRRRTTTEERKMLMMLLLLIIPPLIESEVEVGVEYELSRHTGRPTRTAERASHRQNRGT